MGETITLAEVPYVPVDDQGDPYRWGPEDEVTVSVFSDFWRAWRRPEGKGRAIGPLRWRIYRNSCVVGGATSQKSPAILARTVTLRAETRFCRRS